MRGDRGRPPFPDHGPSRLPVPLSTHTPPRSPHGRARVAGHDGGYRAGAIHPAHADGRRQRPRARAGAGGHRRDDHRSGADGGRRRRRPRQGRPVAGRARACRARCGARPGRGHRAGGRHADRAVARRGDGSGSREQLVQAEANYRNIERDAARQEQLFKQGFIGAVAPGRSAPRGCRREKPVRDRARRLPPPARRPASIAASSTTSSRRPERRGRRRRPSSRRPRCSRRRPASSSIAASSPATSCSPASGSSRSRSTATFAHRADRREESRPAAPGPARAPSADAYPNAAFRRRSVATWHPGSTCSAAPSRPSSRVPAPPPFLRSDMTVSIDIEVADRADALVIPAAARARCCSRGSPGSSRCAMASEARQPCSLGARRRRRSKSPRSLPPAMS